MGLPVVHFEIIGTDPAGLRGYYGALFDWEFQTGDATIEKVSQPGTYGFVSEASAGVDGGIGSGARRSHCRRRTRQRTGSASSCTCCT